MDYRRFIIRALSPFKNSKSRPRQKGFTLLEVMFAVTVLVAGLLPVLGLQSAALNRVSRNKHETQASHIIRKLLLSIDQGVWSRANWDSSRPALEMLKQVTTNTLGAEYEHPYPEEIEPYLVTLNASPWQINGFPPGLMTRVNVRVSWGDSKRDFVEASLIVPLVNS